MYRIVREIQKCVIEYIVIADSDEEAINKVQKLSNDCCEIDVCPEYLSTESFETRSFTDKDAKDPVVKKAISRIETAEIKPLVVSDDISDIMMEIS